MSVNPRYRNDDDDGYRWGTLITDALILIIVVIIATGSVRACTIW